ncbi:MAG: aspartate carbamoyltransferase [Spirochaetota bacterium]
MENVFKGRSLAVIKDLTDEERLYLFSKTRELKEAMAEQDVERIDAFRIDNPDFGMYEVFLEDSTRTRESFKNAAKFHRAKLSSLSTDSSSFNKGESYADTFNTLAGYDNSIFIVRSKIEGVCTWLERAVSQYAERNDLPYKPAFINAGDGKHEHPTQELLDEFTFLEDNNWDHSAIHLALVGDLFHGRTVHSKADGLTIFSSVKIDLVAPPELAMPPSYVEVMKQHGYEVRVFPSIASYLEHGDVADKWYFTRPQLERMGDRILQRQEELREAITFSRKFIKQIPDGVTFYHPLPRHKVHPVIPAFLDETPLNGWERQSANGMLVRIVLLSLIQGTIGDEFEPKVPRPVLSDSDDFIEEVTPTPQEGRKQYSEGVHPIENGLVLDHIGKGDSTEEIRKHMALITKVLSLHGKGGEWVSTSNRDPHLFKGIIFRPGVMKLSITSLKRLAALAPGATLNIIQGSQVKEKFRLHLPPRIYNFENLSCRNENCISHPTQNEQVPADFWRTEHDEFVCEYCGTYHTYKEIWS